MKKIIDDSDESSSDEAKFNTKSIIQDILDDPSITSTGLSLKSLEDRVARNNFNAVLFEMLDSKSPIIEALMSTIGGDPKMSFNLLPPSEKSDSDQTQTNTTHTQTNKKPSEGKASPVKRATNKDQIVYHTDSDESSDGDASDFKSAFAKRNTLVKA
ncbi:hypothetical protein ScalyP_jg11101, partial [Parmales sp. scaly parma]